jgi:hypothetical protein
VNDTAASQLIRHYFELAPQPSTDAYFAQFADNATVVDEGTEHHGIEAIRAWRASVPLVTYTVNTIHARDGGSDAAVVIAGDFPGSPVQLTFHFEHDMGERITRLTIRP